MNDCMKRMFEDVCVIRFFNFSFILIIVKQCENLIEIMFYFETAKCAVKDELQDTSQFLVHTLMSQIIRLRVKLALTG